MTAKCTIRAHGVTTLGAMRAEDVERFRDRWVAVRGSDETVVADAGTLAELRATLPRIAHPQVLIRRIPSLSDPLFIGLG